MFLRERSTGDVMSKEKVQEKSEAQLNTDSLFGGPQKISEEEIEDQEENEEEEGEESNEDEDAGEEGTQGESKSGSEEESDPGTDLEERIYRSLQSSNDKMANQIDKLAGIVTNLTGEIKNIKSKNTFDIDLIKPDDVITGEQLINFKNSLENKSPPKKTEKEELKWKDPTEEAINKMSDIKEVVAFAKKNSISYPAYLTDADIASKYWYIKSKMKPKSTKKKPLPDVSGSEKPGGRAPKKKMNRIEEFFAS